MTTSDTDSYRAGLWPMPVRPHAVGKGTRRLGVELEFSGLDIQEIVEITQQCLGGNIDRTSEYEYFLLGTDLGDFGIELDYAYLKKLGRERDPDIEVDNLDELAESVLALLAKQVVPFEIVSPPIEMDKVWQLETLFKKLRRAGAKGTRHAAAYAFGLHLNPEMPDLKPETILAYLRAFLCLFDWLKERSEVDLSRRVTPYIDPFEKDYIKLLLSEDYAPGMDQLIDDYLEHNPTRNRALDMLPLFTHIDEARVRNVVSDSRVKPRPTLHYRLPNCMIDEADWALVHPWRDWLQIEALACDARRLDAVSRGYRKYLRSPGKGIINDWSEASTRWLIPELL